jgi:cysteinyl-tRNA synthetase
MRHDGSRDQEWFQHPDIESKSLNHLVDQLNSSLSIVGDWSMAGKQIRLKTELTGVIKIPFRIASPWPVQDAPTVDIMALFDARNAAKKAKDFKRADSIRDELKQRGWMIKDTTNGPKLTKLP